MEPPVPCELVRGYLDFSPHAWNIILIKRSDTWVRMLVDACRPHDIREEKDTEFFCRYSLPLSKNGCASPFLIINKQFGLLHSITFLSFELVILYNIAFCWKFHLNCSPPLVA